MAPYVIRSTYKVRAGHTVLTGRLNEHHAFLRRIILRRIDELTAVIEELTSRIDTELVPFR